MYAFIHNTATYYVILCANKKNKPVGGINLKNECQRVCCFRHCVGCQKWSEDFGKRRYCLSVASFVSAEI